MAPKNKVNPICKIFLVQVEKTYHRNYRAMFLETAQSRVNNSKSN